MVKCFGYCHSVEDSDGILGLGFQTDLTLAMVGIGMKIWGVTISFPLSLSLYVFISLPAFK